MFYEVKEQLESQSHIERVKFALWCTKKCTHYFSDDTVVATINAVEAWLLNQSEENRKACRDAAYNTTWTVSGYVIAAAYYTARAAYTDYSSDHYVSPTYHVANAIYNAAIALNITQQELYYEYISEQLFGILEQA